MIKEKPVPSEIQRHNWVTFLLGKALLRSRDRSVSYHLYSYLRQIDDFIDEGNAGRNECLEYLQKQRSRIRELYANGEGSRDVLLGRIIEHDLQNGHKLRECINLMMDVFEFDARRKHSRVAARDLHSYSMTLARAYTQFLIHFVAPRHRHSENDVILAHACHLAHMIRDLMIDHDLGYINISQEDLDTYALEPGRFTGAALSRWLKKEVKEISILMRRGKHALCASRMLRVKLMGLLYCFRYEVILRRIKAAGYTLQTNYPVRFRDFLRLCCQCVDVCMKHLVQCAGFKLVS